MFSLSWAQLRRHPGRYCSLGVAIIAAVALTLSALGLTLSVKQSVDDIFARPYQGTDVVVTQGKDPLDPSQFPASSLIDARTSPTALGTGGVRFTSALATSAVPQNLTDGRIPETDSEVVLSNPEIPLGAQVTLLLDGQQRPMTVVGHSQPTPAEQLLGVRLVALAPGALPAPTGGEILLSAPSGTTPQQLSTELRQQLAGTDAQVATAAAHITTLANTYLAKRDRYFFALAVFVLVVAVVAALVVISGFGVISATRRREYQQLHLIGATTGQIRRMVAMEGFLLGIFGSAVGAALAVATAQALPGIAEELQVAVPLESVSLPLWLIGPVAAAFTVLSMLAGLSTSVRLEQRATRSGRWTLLAVIALGLVLAAGGLFGMGEARHNANATAVSDAMLVARNVGSPAVLVLGTLLVLSGCLPLLAASLGRLGGWLSLSYIRSNLVRSAALTAIIGAGTAIVAASVAGSSVVGASQRAAAEHSADIAITPLDYQPDTLAPTIDQLISILQNTPGVAEVAAPPVIRDGGDTFYLTDDTSIFRDAPAPENADSAVVGKYSPLRAAAKRGGTAVVADHTIMLRTSDNTVSLLDPAAVAPEVLAALPRPTVFVRLTGPASADEAALVPVTAALDQAGIPVSISERISARAETQASITRLLTMTRLLSVVAALIAAVGVINTVLLSIWSRSKDLSLLSAIGMTSWRQLRILLTELSILSVPAAIVGAITGSGLGAWAADALTSAPNPILATIRATMQPQHALIAWALVIGCGLVAFTFRPRTARR